MIDTIKFLIPMKDSELVQKLKGNLMRFRKEDLKTGKVEFEFHSSNIELGSHHRTVAIKSTEVPTGLFIELSIPKYDKGNNVEMIYPHNLPNIMERLYVEICDYMDYELPPYSKWVVYRLDICYNWLLKDADEPISAIDLIKRIDYPRKKKHVWDTSVMFLGTSYAVKFYVKGTEFKAHDAKVLDFDTVRILQPFADRILRFEVGLRRVYLQDFFLKDKVYVEDVSNDDVISEILDFYLKEKVFKYLSLKAISNSEIRQKLLECFTKQKATKLYQFHKSYYSPDDDVRDMLIHGGLNRSTIYRHKMDLKRLGIGLSHDIQSDGRGVLEKLIIPSSDTLFDLLD